MPARLCTRRRLIVATKLVLAASVILAVGRQASDVLRRLDLRETLPRLASPWMAVAAAAYLAGLALDGVWFGRVLDQSTSRVPKPAAIRAYLISHLGKYVPGKAMVVVMRVGLVVPAGARAVTATIATLYETIVMMAAGGMVAAVCFSVGSHRSVSLTLGPLGTRAVPLGVLGLLLGLAFVCVAAPRVFALLTRPITRPFAHVDGAVSPRLSLGLLSEGLCWTACGWLLLGLSQVAVLRALGHGWPPLPDLPAVFGSVALATVAGFAVPIAPGGLGVREWVLWTSLGAVVPHERAVAASVTLRLVWLVAEIVAASVLLLWKADCSATVNDAHPPASTSAP